MLQSSDINVQAITIEPIVYTDISGTTKYIGTTQSFTDTGAAIWKIKKEWNVGSVQYMGFPNGSQEFKFSWDNRASYIYI